jgi:UDP-glucose 4-epimerase
MTVAIVGGSGFTGEKIIEKLCEHSEEVICIDIEPYYDLEDQYNDVTVTKADVTEYNQINDIWNKYKPDRVINLAYLLGADTETDPSAAIQVNCVGMDNIFRASVDHGTKRVLFASSMAVYGLPESFSGPVTEDALAPAAYTQYPVIFYTATKQLNEYQAKLYNNQTDTDFVSIRPSTIFGPGREYSYTSWVSALVSNPAYGENAHIPHKPEKELTMIYRDDVAELFTKAILANKLSYDAYNTGGHYITAGELAEIVETEIGGEISCDSDKPGEYPHIANLDNTRASEDLDFALTPLRESIHQHAKSIH